MTAQEMLNRLNSFSVSDELRRIVFDNQEEIINLNRKKLLQGLDTEGNIIGVYSPFTENFTKGETGKGFPKKAFENWNFFDSGDLQESITVDYENGSVVFFAVDSKLEEIFNTVREHGFIDNPQDVMFGLDSNDADFMNFRILLPDLQGRLRQALGQ